LFKTTLIIYFECLNTMAWFNESSEPPTNVVSDDWLKDAVESNRQDDVDPVEALRRRMETLGQNEGLERGLKSGEDKGFLLGFREEAARAMMLGRCLGAAKAILKLNREQNHALAEAIQEAEQTAATSWVANPRLVDEKLERVYHEMAKLGVTLPEWPRSSTGTQ
jgi:hypothetical protein